MGSWGKPRGDREIASSAEELTLAARDRLEGHRRQLLHGPGTHGMETDARPGEDGNLLKGFQPGMT